MTVKELIIALEALHPKYNDTKVGIIWDGLYMADVELLIESKGGNILLAEHGEVVYHDENRPIGAPNEEEEEFWCTP